MASNQRIPIPAAQRNWLIQLFDAITELLATGFDLRGEIFLQFKSVPAVQKAFLSKAREFQPVLGLSRRPGATLPEMLTKEGLDALIKSGQSLSFEDSVADYSYWFIDRSPKQQMEQFFGYGGLTRLFMRPDENAKAPVLPFTEGMRRVIDPAHIIRLQETVTRGFALKDAFLQKSKCLFGVGLEDQPQYPGILFVLPLLQSSDFFKQAEGCGKWFELFEVYVTESAADRGILFASKLDLEEPLIEILKTMREKHGEYPS